MPGLLVCVCVRERVLVCNGNVAERSKAAALSAVGVLVLPPGFDSPHFRQFLWWNLGMIVSGHVYFVNALIASVVQRIESLIAGRVNHPGNAKLCVESPA